jgi:hypothetical protein
LPINREYIKSVRNLTKEQEQALWKDMISGNKKESMLNRVGKDNK